MIKPTTFLKPESDWKLAYEVLSKSLHYMCAHESEVTDEAAAAAPELTPNPRAVPRDSGLLGFDILMTYGVPAWQGVTIARGDTIIVNPVAAPVAGDIVLVSDGNELTLAAVGDNGLPTSLGDNTGAYLEGVEVLLIGVAIRVRKAPVKRVGASDGSDTCSRSAGCPRTRSWAVLLTC